jgi:FkbM family methyltransferase
VILKDYPEFRSDMGDDRWIVENLLDVLPQFGYAVDVGANDGIFASNTHWLEVAGWNVLCIEANPLLEEDGRKYRKLWRVAACGAEDIEQAPFTYCGGYPYPSASGLVIDPRYGNDASPMGTVQTVVRRLDRLVEEAGFPGLDYVSIDVEGYELEVLKGFDIERWKPKIIVCEDRDGTHQPPPGYHLAVRSVLDDIWVRD